MLDPMTLTEVVTIDGPAGAGKSTVAKTAARKLGFAYLDTGAMYRAATWWAIEQNVNPHDRGALIASTVRMPLEVDWDGQAFRVVVNVRDITQEIRTPNVTDQIRMLDGIPEVRAHLVQLQREFAAHRPIVTEGRDQGTVVFPAAKCKIYLDASLDERARRRGAQYAAEDIPVDDDQLRQSIERRDKGDVSRETGPLRAAPDAVAIDTTGLTLDDVVRRVLALAKERLCLA